MIAYLDSSVLLRQLLRQPRALREWRLVRTAVTSRIAEVECMRTLDRLRVRVSLDDRRTAALLESLHALFAQTEIVEVSRSVLLRASLPSPTSLGTLDAIHLASALLWREHTGKSLAVATHDEELALAARAHGLRVIGV